MRIVCLDGYALNPGDLSWAGIAALGEFTCHDRTPAGQVVQRVGDAEAVLTNKTTIDAKAIAAMPRLRYIGVLATGYNVVDVKAACEHGIVVTNVPAYGTESVAQFVFALLLELCHRVGLHDELVRAGRWSSCPDFTFRAAPLIELAGKTMGIVGLGRIGRRVGQIASAFGMKVIYHDQTGQAGCGPGIHDLEFVELDELFARSDVVSLHVPLTPATRRLVNRRRLALMKPTALLVNTSRGQVVDEDELGRALEDRRIAGAAVDVLSVEPPPADHPLLRAANCIITPHIAWSTIEARRRLMDTVAENLRAWLAGRPVNVVRE